MGGPIHRRAMKWVKQHTLLILSILAFLGAIFALSWSILERTYPLGLINLEEFPLPGHQRVLIMAPHNDDEVLGSAGLIQESLRQGAQVKVVLATNGDGFRWAAMEDFRRLSFRNSDYIRMGNMRQQESLNALKLLGVPAEDVTFLGYPDRGTATLWNDHWDRTNPYTSPFNGSDHSPYDRTYDPQANYSGESYLADLRSIIGDYRPDLIIYPHPDDVHPDHWAMSAFTRAALAQIQEGDPAYQPDSYTYLVHRPDYPWPMGLHELLPLLPPLTLYSLDTNWYRLDISPEDTAVKRQAVNAYRSQFPLLRFVLDSFIRRNELYARTQPDNLPEIAQGNWDDPSTWLDAQGQSIPPVQQDPQGDFLTRKALPGTDLVGLYAGRNSEGDLALCAELRARHEPALVYELRLVAMGPQGVIHSKAHNSKRPQAGWEQLNLNGNYACYQAPVSELGNPWWVFAGADVRGMGSSVFDQVAWQMVRLQPPRRRSEHGRRNSFR